MSLGNLKVLLLCLVATGLVLAQGLNTVASKDDWEEINFEFDSAVLTDGFPSMLRLAELLNQHPDYKVSLTGHADYLGSSQYNDKLGAKRANEVKQFLEKYGARAGQISVASRGEHDPKVNAKSDEARFMNRRVEMVVADAQGKVIGAGGVGDAIGALEKLAKAQEECCNAILKKLDKLDEILAAINGLKDENAKLRDEIDKLKHEHEGLKQEVAEVPKTPAPTKAELAEVAKQAAQEVHDANYFKHFSILGLNVGTDDAGNLTWTGKGRFFRPIGNNFAVQAEAEYLGWQGRKEGQFDFGLVGRKDAIQLGAFASFKNISLSNYDNSGLLGQASVTADYIFGRGKVGVFGAKGFKAKDLIQSRQISRNVIENVWLHTVDQIGVSSAVGLWGNSWAEGNLGFLYGRQAASRAGGTMRLIMPFRKHWAFTAEGGVNETLLSRDTYGRWALGIRFGNFLSPKRYAEVSHPVPVDIPRVRWEVITERIRTGNDPPTADAGPDLIGVPAGMIRLDGSASSDPENDPITFQWTQVAGPSVAINGADQAVATFTAADGQVYAFRLTVTDDQGASGSDSVSVTTKETPQPRVLQFAATPNSIRGGESATLSWQVENADEVTIDNGIGPVNNVSGSKKVTPSESTIYTLTAKNSVAEVTLTVLVAVNTPAPTFLRCDVTPQNILQGESATINWQAQDADTVTLSGFGNVGATGSQTVSPAATSSYTLTATNAYGTASCPLNVQVTPGEVPQILRFAANPLEILTGSSTTLFWQVDNADEVTIDNGVGQVDDKSGSVNVSPADSTVYTLVARNTFGEVRTTVAITVLQPAKVLSFTVTPDSVGAGDRFTLSWNTANATSVVITPNLGSRPPSGSVPLRASSTTTYTVVASNKFSQDTATVTITVNANGQAMLAPAPPGEDPPAAAGD